MHCTFQVQAGRRAVRRVFYSWAEPGGQVVENHVSSWCEGVLYDPREWHTDLAGENARKYFLLDQPHLACDTVGLVWMYESK